MKYYQSDDKLIQFNFERNTYKIRNSTQNLIITNEEFKKLNAKEIKKPEFSRQMNLFFKNINHEWQHQDSFFKKLPNFESSDYNFSTNYKIGIDVPYHAVKFAENCILVYHWNRLYYHTISYNGYKQGQLIDIKTLEYVRWAQLRHCAPVINLTTNKII